jgi:hypothetical protein
MKTNELPTSRQSIKHFTSIFIALFCFLLPTFLLGQQPTQKIRGIVQDKQTKQTLIGASILVNKTDIGVVSDENGAFVLEKVPIGRVAIRCQFIGYEPFLVEDILISSTKEAYLEIELSPKSVEMREVVVSTAKNAFEAVNPLSVVSTRSFTAEETDRIAAGINDPGRIALSFPGVKQGPDETENTIIVRGNSPVGILWRVEGIDIPNPNHFALIGSSVGGVSIFSAQLLSRSDFSSGGMAAEYGNAISAAFDMHFRHGNFEKREHRVKVGIIGLDFSTEGAIQKGKSSYLVNYRYSTLGLLNKMGFNLVGERVTNDFQDVSFNLAFKTKNPKLKATVFGIGGISLEEYLPVADATKRKPNVFDNRNFQHKPAKMGALGTTLTYLPNSKSYFKAVLALIGSDIRRENDTLGETNIAYRYNTEQYTDKRLALSLTYNTKVSEKTIFKTGLSAHQVFFDFFKNNSPLKSTNNINDIEKGVSVQGSGNTQILQHYAQVVHSFSPQLTANIGYHITYLAANKTRSVEPRLSLQYQIAQNQKLSFAYGLQGQILPMMAYYFKDTLNRFINKNLDMLKTHHFVLAYHYFTQNKMKISVETYGQKLFNIPVSPDPNSNYWMLNNTQGYPLFKAVSAGKGLNYGVDAAIEKTFSNAYFLLLTGSVFDSKFQPFNGQEYNSRWASKFTSSLTFGKEFNFKKGRVIQVGGRYLLSGGAPYTPLDPVLSKKAGGYIQIKNADNSARIPNYSRLDMRIQYRYNAKKLSGSISLDIQNVTNHINATGVGYDAATNTTIVQYRGGGLIPILAFQFDF